MTSQHVRDEILDYLKRDTLCVTFTKVDGARREMYCTHRTDIVPPVSESSGKAKNDEVCPVWDVEVEAWRSFRWDSIRDWYIHEYGPKNSAAVMSFETAPSDIIHNDKCVEAAIKYLSEDCAQDCHVKHSKYGESQMVRVCDFNNRHIGVEIDLHGLATVMVNANDDAREAE